jgi:hypothetical protein
MMDFFIEGTHWTWCKIVSVRNGIAKVMLYNSDELMTGRARQTRLGWLVYGEVK